MSQRYFTGPDGIVYRVLDSAWHNGRRLVADPPVPWVVRRRFRAQSGAMRFYPPRVDRYMGEVTEELLAEHFAKYESGGTWVRKPLSQRGLRT